jgi:hypothetical protein
MINRAEARKITYDIKIRKKVNWCILAKWTTHDQLRKPKLLKVALCSKIGHVVDIDNFVDSNKEEEEATCLRHLGNNKFMFSRSFKSNASIFGKNISLIYTRTCQH